MAVRRVGTEGAFAGEPFAFRWAISRREGHAFALTLSEVDVPLAGEGGVGHLPAGAEHVVRADLTAPRRGPVKLSGVRVTTTWPLGLFAKTRVFPLTGTLLVFPRRGYACANPENAATGHVGEASHPHRLDGTGDMAGLRELGEGEDSRRVHWLKSASLGKPAEWEDEGETGDPAEAVADLGQL